MDSIYQPSDEHQAAGDGEEDSDIELIRTLNQRAEKEDVTSPTEVKEKVVSKFSSAESVTVEELIEELDYIDENNTNEIKRIYEKIQQRMKQNLEK